MAEVTRLIETAHARVLELQNPPPEDEGARVKGAEVLRRLRMACMVELLYASGLRISELVALPSSAARTRGDAIMVMGKGSKERLVPLSGPARTAMGAWLEARKVAGMEASRWLFPSSGESGHVTRQQAARDLKDLAIAANLDPARLSRMCCAMPLPAICWPTAPICVWYRPFWAMRMWRRHRSIPMFWMSG